MKKRGWSWIKAKLQKVVVKREDIFLTTKLWCTYHRREKVVEACKTSLSNLGLEYIDLYLIHSPSAFKIQHGTVPIPKSSNKKRLQENFDIFDFEISKEDKNAIDALNKNIRICLFTGTEEDKNYPFGIEY
ncbi:hypothetical protein L9F63_027941 [Diploptera punctata]|uniref:NADP-dependent oxidoreductase domain-containing protein n=1 Tax=Diploptera punctata TaxID=6984 RepID=A0AAD8EH63_DIPPU|nr:hypothetical protein L9F63_027941 [Diploptera punctata]